MEKLHNVSINLIFFLMLGLIVFAPGWYLVTFQLAYVSPQESLFYRFLLSALLIGIGRLFLGEGAPKRLPLLAWVGLALYGICKFGINFWLCYEATNYIVSGLIPAIPAIIFVPALVFDRLLTKAPIPFYKIAGSILACFGVFFLFQREILAVETQHLYGLSLIVLSTFFTLAGTYCAKFLFEKYELPLFWVSSRGLFFGASFFLITLLFGDGFKGIAWEPSFLFSLLYLSVLVTGGVTFLHTYLLKHHGAASASLLWTIIPPGCLLFSTFFEGYNWIETTTLGFALVMIGATLFHAYPTLKEKYFSFTSPRGRGRRGASGEGDRKPSI